MKTVAINLLTFAELKGAAKQKAIDDHYSFMVSYPPDYEDEEGKMVTIENYDPDEEEVIDSIEVNEYYFFADGNLANCTTYTGEHPRAGETILEIGGEEYIVNTKNN